MHECLNATVCRTTPDGGNPLTQYESMRSTQATEGPELFDYCPTLLRHIRTDKARSPRQSSKSLASVWCRVVPCRAVACRAVPFCVVPCRGVHVSRRGCVVSCRVVSCLGRAVPFCVAFFCRLVPCRYESSTHQFTVADFLPQNPSCLSDPPSSTGPLRIKFPRRGSAAISKDAKNTRKASILCIVANSLLVGEKNRGSREARKSQRSVLLDATFSAHTCSKGVIQANMSCCASPTKHSNYSSPSWSSRSTRRSRVQIDRQTPSN